MLPFYENKHKSLRISKGTRLVFPPHLHNEIEIIYCLDGKIEVSNNFHIKVLEKNQLMIALPNQIHSYLNNENVKFILLIIPSELLVGIKNICAVLTAYPFIDDCNPEIKQVILRLLKDHKNSQITAGFIQVLLGRIFEQIKTEPKKENVDSELILQIIEHLNTNFLNEISLVQVAKKFYINQSYLSRMFSEKIGVNFNSYINELRINYSLYLLKTTNKNITEIAYECGFQTQRSFNRSFLHFMKMPPSKYRII